MEPVAGRRGPVLTTRLYASCTLESIPFLWNRNALWDRSLAHILVGEPASTLGSSPRACFAGICASAGEKQSKPVWLWVRRGRPPSRSNPNPHRRLTMTTRTSLLALAALAAVSATSFATTSASAWGLHAGGGSHG